MELPRNLVEEVRNGRAVLFAGAGATKGGIARDGKEPPDGNELRSRIVGQYLTAEYASESLAWVSELAIASSDLFSFQEFVANQFRDLKPADFHSLIASFRWYGIATTNYDRLLETVYEGTSKAAQKLVPFLSNSDRVADKLRDPSSVALLKLHGCVTRTNDTALPLILTIDQYVTYRAARTRLFDMLAEWGSEHPIIFVGYALNDTNLRTILLEMVKNIPSRPRYYLIMKNATQFESDFWGAKNITVIKGTFEEFLRAIDHAIPQALRPLQSLIVSEHPVQRRFVVRQTPSQTLLEFLVNDAEYVHEGLKAEEGTPKAFYSGFGLGWYPVMTGLDVRRHLTDKMLDEVILRPEADRPSSTELYLVKAEAGAGKSVFLRRLAWEAANRAGVLCLYSHGTAPPSLNAFREIAEATRERIFLFMDDAAEHVAQLHDLLGFARARKLHLTVITAERTNEWNIGCESIGEYLSDEFQLHYLSTNETKDLVGLLERHHALGANLVGKTLEERVGEFEKRIGRQLLVALHEATHGRPFREILRDEYAGIVPAEAQHLYLTVCVLNRLGIAVRAGLMSRVHGIPFQEFRDRLFKPLEHVIHVTQLPWGDYAYITRHPEIAQIVFDEVLADTADRYNEYVRVIRYLNPLYSTDRESLRGLLRARTLNELFPSYEDAIAIFDTARDVLGEDVYLLQQRANYERIRPSGNLKLAHVLLDQARNLDPTDTTVVHTLAEVVRSEAEKSDKPLERSRLRGEARTLLRSLANAPNTSRYAAVTQLKLALDELRDLLCDEGVTDRQIDEAVRDAERAFEIAKQRYPDERYVSVAESDFATLLDDHDRAVQALMRARTVNPRDPFIAGRLANLLVRRGDTARARAFLEEALESNSGDKRLNFQYADLLRTIGDSTADELAYYYHRAFSKWDENYESQFWYARFAFESRDAQIVKESKEVFRHLRDVPMRHEERVQVRDVIGDDRGATMFAGTIARLEAGHGFVSMDGRGDWVFLHRNEVQESVWDRLATGTRVTCSVGFNLRGPMAVNIHIEGSG